MDLKASVIPQRDSDNSYPSEVNFGISYEHVAIEFSSPHRIVVITKEDFLKIADAVKLL